MTQIKAVLATVQFSCFGREILKRNLFGGSAPMSAVFHRNYAASTIVDLLGSWVPHFQKTIVRADLDHKIVGAGDPADNFFLVMSGLFRGVRTTPDGRRQVFAFYRAGDLCGLEPDGRHHMTIEAAVDAGEIAILPRQSCHRWMNDSLELRTVLFEGATRALTLTTDHAMMMTGVSAESRLAWFLAALAERSDQPNGRLVDLPMCRQDIADYLRLTIETVGHILSLFEEHGVVGLPDLHRVEILHPAALMCLAAVNRDAAPVDSKCLSGNILNRLSHL